MHKFIKISFFSLLSASSAFIIARVYFNNASLKVCDDNANIFKDKFPIPDKLYSTKEDRKKAISIRNAAINAFSHCYTSAKLTTIFGANVSKKLGDFNEWIEDILNYNVSDSLKDEYNNAVGRNIALSLTNNNSLERTCLEACKTDVLINSINNSRIDSIRQNQLDFKIPAGSIANIMRP